MLIYDDFSKKMSRHIKNVSIASLKVFKIHSVYAKFQ